jgi:hypothetical protein
MTALRKSVVLPTSTKAYKSTTLDDRYTSKKGTRLGFKVTLQILFPYEVIEDF